MKSCQPSLFFITALFHLSGCADETSDKPKSTPTDSAFDDTDPDTGSETELDDGLMGGHQVFEQDEILEYRITMEKDDREEIEAHGDEEVYLPASLTITGGKIDEAYDTVGFRHKGAWTLHHCYETGARSYEGECAKISYKVKFNEFDSEARLFGLKKINLHAMSGDGSKLRERLGYDMFNQFGVDAPRTAYAKLFINDELMGLFVQIEQIDGRYTAFHFPHDGDGNLYKETWPKPDMDDEHFLAHLRTNDDPEDHPDVSDIQDFSSVIDGTAEETFESDMADWVDLDNLLRYIAVDRAIKNWDGIVTFYSPYSPHNFYWYHEAAAGGIFHLIPWDLDNTFWEFDPFMDPQDWATAPPMPDWNMEPADCERRSLWDENGDTTATPPGCDKLINLLARTGWERFVEIGNTLLDGPLDYDTMKKKLNTWRDQIKDAVRDDPYIEYSDWVSDVDGLRYSLEQAVTDFTNHLTEGYVKETPPDAPPEPTEEALNAAIEPGGLRADIINNFEFEGNEGTALEWISSYGADTSNHTSIYNTDTPISGGADFRYEFEFHRIDGAWNEWVNVGLAVFDEAPVNLSDFAEISITMQTDAPRQVRVRLHSPVYDELWGGIWSEFGVDFSVTTEPEVYKLKLDRLYYPEWAVNAWETGMGWTGDEDIARAQVIETFAGLVFAPAATTDTQGELVDEIEPGFLQIDNIYFR